ncbi:sensor histidine kinase [Streptomyces sp. NPDC090052]|uniref:sensor histidine kinase n=1 Tax=unclassified Streptomyces TaxID=2593676 RepID=UPI00225507FF|nr:sensor histidine kinase [Streptomyces sp. NBC_01306]MCX4723989.1 sensor histidine kinase [Streptomyces sp. NBC_01306]
MNEERAVGIGKVPENRREAARKMVWIGIWLIFLSTPLNALLDGRYSAAEQALGWTGLTVFVGLYLVMVFRNTSRSLPTRTIHLTLAVLGALAIGLNLTLGSPWLVLFVYVAVNCGAVLPLRRATWGILGTTALMCLLSLRDDHPLELAGPLLIPALLGGFAMTGVRQLIRTTVELKQARATVAQLAANEERLRMARDLHDLLGHSLSLITLKSELAGRMLPDRPGQAAAQVADIEQVSRQALADVREAVTGYRRPTLPGELAGARTALAAAGIAADVPTDVPEDCRTGDLDEDQEAALAWALREGITNVVRHSAARHCTVALSSRQTLDGRRLELMVRDDGRHAVAGPRGNGLTGLAERLAQAGGTLDTQAGPGFTLTARVPIGSGA